MERRALTTREQFRLDHLRARLATLVRYGSYDVASVLADEILDLIGYRRCA